MARLISRHRPRGRESPRSAHAARPHLLTDTTAGPPSASPRSFLRNERAGAPSVRPHSFLRNEWAAEEVLGVIMLLAIFATSMAVIYAGGLPSLQAAQSLASLQQVEQAFTSLDSKLSKAALGESPSQTVTVALAGGSFNTLNTTWMNVTIKDSNGAVMDCINLSLGSIEYVKDNRTIAYEGGGIWARYPDGGQVMLSPPEFHYDGTTLTLPTVRINGSGGASGSGFARVIVNTSNLPTVHYPLAGNTGPCAGMSTAQSRRPNPLSGGNVTITVRSEYYQAWTTFFNSSNVLQLVTATASPGAKTATATLSVQPPDKDNAPLVLPIKIVCINSSSCSNPVRTFTIDLAGRLVNSCGQIQLDLRTPSSNSGASGSDGLHIRVDRAGGAGFSDVTLTVDWKNGSTTEKWDPVTVASLNCNPVTVDATVDLLNYTHTTRSSYNTDVSKTWGTTCDLDPTWWDATWAYPVTPPYPPAGKSCYDGSNPISGSCDDAKSSTGGRSTPPIGYIVSHYLKKHVELWGAVNFQCGGAPGDKCPGDATSISLESDYSLAFSCGSSVTYLHISQNALNVSIG